MSEEEQPSYMKLTDSQKEHKRLAVMKKQELDKEVNGLLYTLF